MKPIRILEIGALIGLLVFCLALVFGASNKESQQGISWGGRPTNAMDAARNADTSNFDTVLKF